jgi:hypothetical protein
MHYLLFYEKVADHAAKEAPLQSDHLQHVLAAIENGHVILAGSLADPVDGSAVLVFKTDSPDLPTAFAKADPYVIHGIVNRWHVRAWHTI